MVISKSINIFNTCIIIFQISTFESFIKQPIQACYRKLCELPKTHLYLDSLLISTCGVYGGSLCDITADWTFLQLRLIFLCLFCFKVSSKTSSLSSKLLVVGEPASFGALAKCFRTLIFPGGECCAGILVERLVGAIVFCVSGTLLEV